MNKKYWLIPIVLFCAAFLFLTCRELERASIKSLESIRLVWSADAHQESISLFERDGVYYGLLPAYVRSVTLQTDFTSRLFLDGRAYTRAPVVPEGEHILSIRNLWGRETARVPLVLMHGEHIPTISIQLTDGSPAELSQAKICRAYMSVTEPDAHRSFAGEVKEFHIRGNHTATLPKTSYRLQFKNGVDLLGTGTDTAYCLIANTDDETKMRNKLAYDTARELGLAHAPASRYVDLYVDGIYYGLYLLTERVNVAPNRINLSRLQERTEAANFYSLKHYDVWNSGTEDGRRAFSIPTNPADITGGYLLEKEMDYRLGEHDNVFISKAGNHMSVKYPAQCSAAQINYIADYFADMEDAIAGGTYENYIDVESWAKYYLIEEFFSQTDGASIYFYKDSDTVDSKMYAGPVWDFDWSFGLGGAFTGGNTLVSPNEFHFNTGGLFQALYRDERFFNTLRQIYKEELRPILTDVLPRMMKACQEQISASYSMDAVRWEGIYISPYGIRCGSLQASVGQMKNWLRQRLACVDRVFLEGAKIIPVTLHVRSDIADTVTYSFVEGDPALYLPTGVPREGYTLTGWIDESGGPADLKKPVTEGTSYTAVWEADALPVEEEDSPAGNSYTDTADYIVLLCFAALCLLIPVGLAVDLRQNREKRKKDGQRATLSP